MKLSKKEEKLVEEALTLCCKQIVTSLSPEHCEAVRKCTIGDMIINFEATLESVANTLKCVELSEKTHRALGFKDAEKLDESILREYDEFDDFELVMSPITEPEPYNPVPNEFGGLDFEDYGAGEQAGMIRSNLFSIFTKAQSMYDMIDENDRLPEWLQEKIAVADNDIGTAHDYLKHEYSIAKQEPVALHVHEAFGREPAHAVSEIIADADTGRTLEVYGSNRFYDDGTVTSVRFGNMFTLTLDENDLSKLIDLLQRLA